ncbi:hypothetical protein [Dyella choica]|uniref:Uncharacterized protein n=1 Tax=Dyella choica TaxID=1927959 RepID=A0A432MAJ4_9GAMM|nr:hypothetical protein [Dyella choica]RUL78345.1 hypothetical protein EKH80_05840 [Dyella choica]
MSASRILTSVWLGLGVAAGAHARDNSAFTVAQHDGSGKALVFQSNVTLKKGDVIKVNASNAQPVMVLQVAMCDDGCLHPRLVRTLPLTPYYAGQTSASQQFVLPEDGQVSFWVQQLGDLPGEPLNAPNGTWTLQYIDPFLRFASQTPYESTKPMPANAFSLDDNMLRARFFHRTFVTVSLADAGQ